MEGKNSVVDQVEEALHRLYSDPTQNDVSGAEKWLRLVQESPEAWNISWQLLRKEEIEIKNFGALLLQNKIAKYWTELPQAQYEPLKVELFKAIIEFSNGPKLILTRLCVAMVMYMFHAIPEVWPNALVSSISTLNSNKSMNSTRNFIALLELLKILPEEFDRTNNELFAQKRVLIRQEIMNGRSTVFMFLEQLLSNRQQLGSHSIAHSVVTCISSWSIFAPPLPEVRSLIELLFKTLPETELMADSSEALVKILAHEDSYKYSEMIQQFLVYLLQLSDFINAHLQQDEPDMDICCSLCYLATDILESNMCLLIEVSEENSENSEESIDGLQLLLGFTLIPGSYPVEEKCSEITLSFWESFLDRIASEDVEHSQFLLEFYGTMIRSLIEHFPIKCCYPAEKEWEQVWDETEKADFLKYRDLLRDLGESIQRTLYAEYVGHLSTLLSDMLLSQSTTPTWQAIESVLFLLQGATSNINEESSIPFRNVLSLFSKMPVHKILVRTALRLLGYLSDWFRRQPDALQCVLPMILNGLTDIITVSSASVAFREVCGDCSQLLVPYVAQIIEATQLCLSNSSIPGDDCCRVIAAAGCVLSILPVSALTQPLNSLITLSLLPVLEQLTMEEPCIDRQALILREMSILSSLCQHVYPTIREGEQHPVVLLLLHIWSTIKVLLTKWIEDNETVSTICSCLKCAIANCQHHYMPLIEATTQVVLHCFSTSHHPGLLKVAKQLIKQFGCIEICQNYLSGFLQNIFTISFQYCHQQGIDNVNPDLLRNFIKLYTQSILSCPVILINIEEVLLNGIDLGMSALHLPESLTIKTSSCLLSSIIELSTSYDAVNKVVLFKGLDLVQCLLKGVAGSINRSQLDHVSNVFIALTQYQLEGLATWLKELLSQEGFPSPHPSSVEKEMFKSTILRSRGNKKAIKGKVKEFSLTCRGFHGTLYASETS